MMKKIINSFLIIVILSVFSFQALSQSATLTREINNIKELYSGDGFTLLEEGGGLTDSEYLWVFDKEYWPIGYEYVILGTADCDGCTIDMKFHDLDRNEIQLLSPKKVINGSLKGGRFKFEKTKNSNGKFYVHSDTNVSFYVYALLFSKKTY